MLYLYATTSHKVHGHFNIHTINMFHRYPFYASLSIVIESYHLASVVLENTNTKLLILPHCNGVPTLILMHKLMINYIMIIRN